MFLLSYKLKLVLKIITNVTEQWTLHAGKQPDVRKCNNQGTMMQYGNNIYIVSKLCKFLFVGNLSSLKERYKQR